MSIPGSLCVLTAAFLKKIREINATGVDIRIEMCHN